MLGVNVVCAPSEEEARWFAAPSALAILRLRSGYPGKYPTPEEAAEYTFTPAEREIVPRLDLGPRRRDARTRVRDDLRELATRTGADELMLTTVVHGHAERRRSYELVADAMDVTPLPAAR